MKFKTVVLTFAALAASSSLAAAFYGTGGVITRDGDYVIHTFTNATDTFTVKGSGKIDVLLVGGGGGGGTGRAGAGGGGGGGVVYVQNVDVTEQPYAILVGEGGSSGETGGGYGCLCADGAWRRRRRRFVGDDCHGSELRLGQDGWLRRRCRADTEFEWCWSACSWRSRH